MPSLVGSRKGAPTDSTRLLALQLFWAEHAKKILGVLNAYTNTFNFIRPYALLRFVPVQFVHILLLRLFRKSPEHGKYPYMCTAVRGTRAPIARYMMT